MSANGDIKIVIVEDSALVRILISDLVTNTKGLDVIGTARDGKRGVDTVAKLRPDLVLMDLNMPRYNGEYAVRRIMKECPTPILILSAVGNTDLTPILNLLEMGAVDYINKAEIKVIKNQLLRKIIAVASADINNAKIGKIKRNTNLHTFSTPVPYDVVVIGASTGGPSAIENIITKLPRNFPIPVIVAQHMPQNFINSFIKRLNSKTPLHVKLAERGEKIQSGYVYLSSGVTNTQVKNNSLNKKSKIFTYTKKQYPDFNNPSITAMMESVAQHYGKRAISVMLTGMGKDGARGMLKIKKKGGIGIIQSEKTCVVYGMPKEAESIGAATHVVNLSEIGGFIVSCLA